MAASLGKKTKMLNLLLAWAAFIWMYKSRHVVWNQKEVSLLWHRFGKSESCSVVSDSLWPQVHGILQARKLQWVDVPFSKGSSQPRVWTQVSHTACRFFTSWGIILVKITTVQFSSSVVSNSVVSDSLWPHDCSMPGFPVHHQLLKLT